MPNKKETNRTFQEEENLPILPQLINRIRQQRRKVSLTKQLKVSREKHSRKQETEFNFKQSKTGTTHEEHARKQITMEQEVSNSEAEDEMKKKVLNELRFIDDMLEKKHSDHKQKTLEIFTNILNSSSNNKDENQIESDYESDDEEESVMPLEKQIIDKKILFKQICDNCQQKMKLYKDKSYCSDYVWQCNICNTRKKIYSDHRYWSQFRLPLSKILMLFFIQLPKQLPGDEIQLVCEISSKTLTKVRKVYLEMLTEYFNLIYLPNFSLLGSKESVVEIDESCFRRKYNRGRPVGCSQVRNKTKGQSTITQRWILGLTERGKGLSSTLFFSIPDRTKQTLIIIIQTFVSKISKLVCTDQQRAYGDLKKEGYRHETINHSKNFVKPAANQRKTKKNIRNINNQSRVPPERYYLRINGQLVHTQCIENCWKILKQRLKLKVGKRMSLMSSIYEAQFYLSFRKIISDSILLMFQQLHLFNI